MTTSERSYRNGFRLSLSPLEVLKQISTLVGKYENDARLTIFTKVSEWIVH